MVKVPSQENQKFSLKGFHMSFKEIDDNLKQKRIIKHNQGEKLSLNHTQLREWDLNLLSYFKPFYAPLCDMCCLCTYGKCDLSENKKGACGINLEKQQSRMVLLSCCIGASTHAAHARELVDRMLEIDPELELDYGHSIELISPITTTLTGITPRTVQDLDRVMTTIEKELTNLMASAHTGQEGDYLEFESKALHAGMIDTLALEVAELVQINMYQLPKGEADNPLIEIGMGVIDRNKPVILCIGHNIAPSSAVINYAEEMDFYDEIEVCGLCCSAMEMGRYSPNSKIVGPISRQLMFIKSGIADVVVLDEQCIRADILEQCTEKEIPIIATSDKCSLGLPDLTTQDPNKIVTELASKKLPGVLIRDPLKVGKVAVLLSYKVRKGKLQTQNKTKIELQPLKTYNCKDCMPCDDSCFNNSINLPIEEESAKAIETYIKACHSCGLCNRVCPSMLPIKESINEAKHGDNSLIFSFYGRCVGCGTCEEECPQDLPLLNLIRYYSTAKIDSEKFLMRSGRGPIQDIEIRKVGAPIVFGDIPGVILLAACSNYANGEEEIRIIAEEYLQRGYIVLASGCAAMDISLYQDDEGKTLYEKYGGKFDRGNLVNLGSCVTNSHAIGSAIKIANIFAKVPLENNPVKISDYILNRIGVVVIGWGAMSQKAFAIVTGANRWGIPAVMGPQTSKYKRLYLGDNHEARTIIKKDGTKMIREPTPLHLAYSAESINECMVMAAKLCIRPNDTPRGRLIKLTNYVDLHEKYYGSLPSDLAPVIRSEKEIPYTHKEKIKEKLRKNGWKPMEISKEPSLLK